MGDGTVWISEVLEKCFFAKNILQSDINASTSRKY